MVDMEKASDIAATGKEPHESAQGAELNRRIRGALQKLSAEHREVLELTFYQELSYQEIAEVMQCPVNTVKTRMFYAKKGLQEILEEKGIAGEGL